MSYSILQTNYINRYLLVACALLQHNYYYNIISVFIYLKKSLFDGKGNLRFPNLA